MGSGDANRSLIGEIVVFIDFGRLGTRLIAILQLLLRCGDNAEVVLGVLQIVLGKDRIPEDCASRASCRYFSATWAALPRTFTSGPLDLEIPAQRIDVLAPAIVVPGPAGGSCCSAGSHRSRYAFKMSLWVEWSEARYTSGAHEGRPRRARACSRTVRAEPRGLITSGRVPCPGVPSLAIQRRR